MSLTQINKAGLDEIALDHVFTIGASGSSAYTFQGEGLNGTVNNPTLYLTRGKTYRFENGTGGHPIRIQSTSGASGTAYNTGVTNNASAGTVIVEVQHDAPDVLYYQCTSHANMNGVLYITGALADGGVTTAKLADDAVTQPKIASNAVTTDNIANNAVTTATINNDAVTSSKIANSQVTTAKINDQAVTLAKLEHGTSSNNGKFLRANNGADPTFETVNTDLVADTSPQLGGELDLNGNIISVGDGGPNANQEHIRFGNDGDLRIYHDGNNSAINEVGAGNLYIQGSNNIYLRDYDTSENHIVMTKDGSVDLHHNNIKKLETTSDGATVTGDLTATGLNVADDIVHTGDTDTKIEFADNRIMLATAGSDRIDIRHNKIVIGHADEITINDEEAIRLNIPENTDLDNAGNNRDTKGKITIAAGDANNATPNDDCTVIQITPEQTRSSTVGSKHGGIGWQHLSPLNWTGYQGNQIWMGSSLHDTVGQERANYQIWMNNQTGQGSQPNNHAFNLSPEGYHSFPKLPAFSCHKTTSTGDNQTVVFNAVDVNNGGHYNSSNGRFTAPEDGLYYFSFYGMGPNSTSSNIRLLFRINGNNHSSGEYYGGVGYSGGPSYNHVTISSVFSLSANDYVTLFVSNGYDDLHDNHMKFSGFKIG